jgi:hypothetical protein
MYTNTMADILKYNLKEINDISYSGFYFEMPKDTYDTINYLCSQVGAPKITSKIFTKSIPQNVINVNANANTNANENISYLNKIKRKNNKVSEISSDEWESIRSFQTTKIEQKVGIDADINEIRLYLNKLTDKTFLDTREKIIIKINSICSLSTNIEKDTNKIGLMLYEICSTNKFYSKIFADLFTELVTLYGWLYDIFKENYKNIMELYNDIQYVDSEKDYDGFCEMNKRNERRRSITTFFFNLALNGFIAKDEIVKLLRDILTIIVNMINITDKKNEVDELTEIVGILFNKNMIDDVYDYEMPKMYYVLDQSILNVVSMLAQQKAKNYPSLSNKAIFKYMDLVDI